MKRIISKIDNSIYVLLFIVVVSLIVMIAVLLNINTNLTRKAVASIQQSQNISNDENNAINSRAMESSDVERIILNQMFPIGSIYYSVSDENPSNFIGGEWNQISEGRVLMGAGTNGTLSYTAGTTVEAGVPNITGRANLCLWAHGPSGAFYMTRHGSYNSVGGKSRNSRIFCRL